MKYILFKLFFLCLFLFIAGNIFAVKCGFLDRLTERERAKAPLSRPIMQSHIDGEHFRVWFDTVGTNQCDTSWAHLTLTTAERCWRFEVDTLGFRPPLPDSSIAAGLSDVGGNDLVDIYIENMALYYGETQPETYIDSAGYHFATAYMLVSSDYSDFPGYEEHPERALFVTVAHEFFHTIQLHYTRIGDRWFMEATAVTMEELSFDDVNDYYAYLPYFLDNTDYDLSTTNGAHEYGAVLLPLFFVERYGTGFLNSVWGQMQFTPIATSAMDSVFVALGSSFNNEFAGFTYACIRTGERYPAQPNNLVFSEGANYPEMPLDTFYLSDDDTFSYRDTIGNEYAFKAVSIEPFPEIKENNYNLTVHFSASEYPYGFVAANIPYRGAEELSEPYIAIADSPITAQVKQLWFAPVSVVVPSHLSGDGVYKLSAVLARLGIATEKSLGEPFPNPADAASEIFFPMNLNENALVHLSVFDAGGSLVGERWQKMLYRGGHSSQPTALCWNSKNDGGNPVAVGVYRYVISLSTGETKKGIIIIK